MFKSLPFDPNDELLTPLETAKILKMTVGTLAVCRSTKTKELKWLKLGKSVRYRRSEVYRYINEHLNQKN